MPNKLINILYTTIAIISGILLLFALTTWAGELPMSFRYFFIVSAFVITTSIIGIIKAQEQKKINITGKYKQILSTELRFIVSPFHIQMLTHPSSKSAIRKPSTINT